MTGTPVRFGGVGAAAALAVCVLALAAVRGAAPELDFKFASVAPEAGLTDVVVFGGTETNKYLLETTGYWRCRPRL